MTRYIPIGDVELRLDMIARALGIPAATLEKLRSGEWVAVPKINPSRDRAGYDAFGYLRWSPTACMRCGYERNDCNCPVGFAAAPEPTRHD